MSWYLQHFDVTGTWQSLLKQSSELESLVQARFLLSHINLRDFDAPWYMTHLSKKVSKVTKIFTASRDGWHARDFHEHCDKKGPTLCLIRTNFGYLAAGFTNECWDLDDDSDDDYIVEDDPHDPRAMLFALTKELRVFRVLTGF